MEISLPTQILPLLLDNGPLKILMMKSVLTLTGLLFKTTNVYGNLYNEPDCIKLIYYLYSIKCVFISAKHSTTLWPNKKITTTVLPQCVFYTVFDWLPGAASGRTTGNHTLPASAEMKSKSSLSAHFPPDCLLPS